MSKQPHSSRISHIPRRRSWKTAKPPDIKDRVLPNVLIFIYFPNNLKNIKQTQTVRVKHCANLRWVQQSFFTKRFNTKRYSQTNSVISFRSFALKFCSIKGSEAYGSMYVGFVIGSSLLFLVRKNFRFTKGHRIHFCSQPCS